jgi:long-chain acyl-CoA synthetase
VPKASSIGKPIPGVELRLLDLDDEEVEEGDPGELVVRGANLFSGYWPDGADGPDADGWLLTGDIGELDRDGFLKITDRKKDLFKTSGGKYIAPGAIENSLRRCRAIGQAVVLGDGRPFVAALITLDPEALRGRRSKDDAETKRLVDEAVGQVNRSLSHPEQIKKWTILEGDFVVGDELTPTMKVRRKRIAEKYASEIEALYADKKMA